MSCAARPPVLFATDDELAWESGKVAEGKGNGAGKAEKKVLGSVLVKRRSRLLRLLISERKFG